MRIKILFASLLGLIFSCNSQKTTSGKLSSEYTILYQSAYGGADAEGLAVISSEKDLTDLCSKLQIDKHISASFPKIDFIKNDVLALYLGQRTTGGYEITVQDIVVSNDTTVVIRNTKAPKAGELVTMALTNPYCLVLVAKNKKYELK